MKLLDQITRALSYAAAGLVIGPLIGILLTTILGGLNGLVLGIMLSPVTAIAGVLVGFLAGIRTHPDRLAAAGLLPGKSAKPFDFDDNFHHDFNDGTPPPPAQMDYADSVRWRLLLWLALASPIIGLCLFWKVESFMIRRHTAAYLEQIASGEDKRRAGALAAIRAIGPAAASTVSEALNSPDRSRRQAAALASQQVLEPCLETLGTMNCAFGIVPGRGTAHDGFMQVVPALIRALDDEDAAVRLEAARVLAHLREDQWEGIEIPQDRIQAILPEGIGSTLDLMRKKEFLDLLVAPHPQLESDVFEALAEATRNLDMERRAEAINALMETLAQSKLPRSKEGRDALRRVSPLLSNHARASQNYEVLTALGQLGEKDSVADFRRQLDGRKSSIKMGAAFSLGRLASRSFSAGDDVDASRLRDELRDCVDPLAAVALHDPDHRVRETAASALAEFGREAVTVLPALQQAAERETDAAARQAIDEACQSIRRDAEREQSRNQEAPRN